MCLFLKKLAISFLLAKFACASLEVKFSDVNLLHSWLKIKYIQHDHYHLFYFQFH